ncbi:Poly(A)-specific ribonuclease PARN-like domain-containing protein 1 [Myotis davidii]|uniref:Poly(A)-specific ribonuclease PARN-like domain-containing protein 1 n=1 Tax=Myotis davidii TaxID=225400 RepID=L5M867_MYODS|nr:Poly(A)-specific ribonuclease PARN-like domain-containing protein 1 [Myotis davidii]
MWLASRSLPTTELGYGTLVFFAFPAGLDIEFTGLRTNVSRSQQIRYIAHSCNFFLFPTTFGILDSEFSFQASSVQFLNQYGFDYNKFLKHGIPYMNEEQEKQIKHNILTGNWRVRSSLDKDQMKAVIDEVTRWLHLAEEGDWMTLPGIAGFQAFEVQLVLRQALPDIWTVLRDQAVIVKKVSRQHRWYLQNTSSDRESCWKEKILLSARGFSVFFQMLVKAQKQPLVGHNMLMDLLHLHEKFFRPLPENYHQFKSNIHSLFPVLLDTKNVTKDIWKRCRGAEDSFIHMNLRRRGQEQRDCSQRMVFILFSPDSDLNPTKDSGPVIIHASKCEKYVLLKVAHLLLWRVHGAGPTPEPSFPLYLDVLAPYMNQVNLIRAGVPKINFSGPDYPSIRPPILILSVRRWPGVTEQQIYREFQCLCKFDVRRLTRNQFLLLTNKFKDARSVLREYRGHPVLQVSLYRYWRHSPDVRCLLQVCGIVTAWALLTFLLGRPGP